MKSHIKNYDDNKSIEDNIIIAAKAKNDAGFNPYTRELITLNNLNLAVDGCVYLPDWMVLGENCRVIKGTVLYKHGDLTAAEPGAVANATGDGARQGQERAQRPSQADRELLP